MKGINTDLKVNGKILLREKGRGEKEREEKRGICNAGRHLDIGSPRGKSEKQ